MVHHGLVELHPDYPVRTDRLLLRPLSPDDTAVLVAYRSKAEVCRYLPFEPMNSEIVAEKLATAWSHRTITTEGNALTLGVELAETGEMIGEVILFFHSVKHRGGELGWVFHPRHSGHGYATEAAHAMLHLAFDELRLHRVTARVVAANSASLRLADRLGMRQEAHLIGNEWFKGGWSDEIDFALLENEWADQHSVSPAFCAQLLNRPPQSAR